MNYKEFRLRYMEFPFFTDSSLRQWGPSWRTIQNQMSRWRQSGEVIQLRRGLYTLNESNRKVEADPLVISSEMVSPSYVSLEWALAHFGFIPERVDAVTAITTKKTQRILNPLGKFVYRHVKESLFVGFTQERTPGKFPYFLATREKALFDFLYLNLDDIDPSRPEIFEESYRFQYLENLDWEKMMSYVRISGGKKLQAVVQALKKWNDTQQGEIV